VSLSDGVTDQCLCPNAYEKNNLPGGLFYGLFYFNYQAVYLVNLCNGDKKSSEKITMGELIQIYHMVITRNNVVMKQFSALAQPQEY
jgi:hypothetical protein